jgi:hypothetical protein
MFPATTISQRSTGVFLRYCYCWESRAVKPPADCPLDNPGLKKIKNNSVTSATFVVIISFFFLFFPHSPTLGSMLCLPGPDPNYSDYCLRKLIALY